MLSSQGDAVFTPVNKVVTHISESQGRLVRLGDYSLVVDIDQGSLERMMGSLRGWTARPVQRTRDVSAFEGMLDYHIDKQK